MLSSDNKVLCETQPSFEGTALLVVASAHSLHEPEHVHREAKGASHDDWPLSLLYGHARYSDYSPSDFTFSEQFLELYIEYIW
ncbi:hypothetical protein KSX_44480 [Ktedonospora formicarum]|uniref:Uncharacterized protein n=1 Tax=Ktedonospora formicarum TaxID=2778364 RepID=A0A8J3MSM8_9CHLR|nr:hypothetical protein KSX_44480 [Ktedonospora formicarum]